MMTPPEPLDWMHDQSRLTAMLHQPAGKPHGAILMLPGGSDYRIGSHRSYVRLALALAESGYAVMRMDASGMGDSGGSHPGFEALGPEIASGLKTMRQILPVGIKIYLWGQCDGASAILLGLGRNFEADGAILCNPWVRTAQTSATQVVRHHYRRRLANGASWRKLLNGQTNILASLRSFFNALKTMSGTYKKNSNYLDDIIKVLRLGRWPCLIVIGSDDAGGQEFRLLSQRYKLSDSTIEQSVIMGGNHSFSRPDQRQQLLTIACNWLEIHNKIA
jgi:uncharacterized protein